MVEHREDGALRENIEITSRDDRRAPCKAPLYERLVNHQRSDTVSFHVPGHKYGVAMPDSYQMLQPIMAFDFTEITGLDDLHQPEGVIREAEQLAAQCYGADRTFFLVQGSSLGNMAMILTVCGPGDILLTDRFVHKSVLNGLMLANAKAVFISPKWDQLSGQPAGIDEEELAEALERYPEAKGILLTRPNYYGQACDLTSIVKMAHEARVPVLVDEAHGAHFGFHNQLPPSALQCGADAVVQSTHKMLSALTMGSMLHIQGSLLDSELVGRNIGMLQTSSPSYPIMASLDAARQMMHTQGEDLIDRGLQVVRQFELGMADMPWFELTGFRQPAEISRIHQATETGRTSRTTRIHQATGTGRTGRTIRINQTAQATQAAHAMAQGIIQDPFKQTVRDRTGTFNGYALQDLLERNGCMIEMADPRQVLLVWSPYSTSEDARRILETFRLISTEYQLDKKELSAPLPNIYKLPKIPVSVEPVEFSRHRIEDGAVRTVPIAEAVGEYSADPIIPYPPGIPFVYRGERIGEEIAVCLQEMARLGARFQGTADANLSTIRIMVR